MLSYWGFVTNITENLERLLGNPLQNHCRLVLTDKDKRSTIHPIINRLGVETLIGQMARFREDERFKSVGPDSIIMPYPTPAFQPSLNASVTDEVEVWFDWAFVDFWKSNYCK